MKLHHSFLVAAMFTSACAQAETGAEAWLRYARVTDAAALKQYAELPHRIVMLGSGPIAKNAADELARGLQGELGLATTRATSAGESDAFVLGTPSELEALLPVADRKPLAAEGFRIVHVKPKNLWLIEGNTPSAELYGVFHLLESIGTLSPTLEAEEEPQVPIRWTDEWDNLNGTIERGYAGRSIFFDNGHVRADLTRAGEYARLLSSIGINGSNVNNVNADLDLLTTEHLKEFARIADAFRPWGVRLALSIDLTSPRSVGGLTTFDPLDPTVIAWWKTKVDEIYTLIPDFGGFTVKADSEGREGPSKYGRSPADAANVLARALAPHKGVVLYRGFVYNNHLDWQDLKADRARAGVDNFVKYDGTFEPNVIIQIKEGPIDFQAREPVSPLFSALQHTPEAIELQTAQEYTGQQRHLIWLPSMWQWVLNTDTRANDKPTTVASIVEGKAFHQPTGGFISVTNVGLEANWLHHPMAMANLYGFGKLAWNPAASLPAMIDHWTRLTWGNDPQVVRTITAMELKSWGVYEGYTGPHGMGTLTNILGDHFGPGIESAERNGWGQWFRGEKDGIGMDRSVSTGTGYAGQYPPQLAKQYESAATTPEDLLLFFHHVPYDYKLRNGKTLVQDIYDTHYAGALAAAEYVPTWESLKGKIDDERYAQVLTLLQFQAGHAIEWRDSIDQWFARISDIPDAKGRVGHAQGRIEAEAMTAEGYTVFDVNPWETASGGKAVECRVASGCTLTTKITQTAGMYDIAVQYYDLHAGESRYTLSVNGKPVGAWTANDTLPPAALVTKADGQDATRYTAYGVALRPGDTLVLRGVPDLKPATTVLSRPNAPALQELAPVDYLQIGPNGAITPQ